MPTNILTLADALIPEEFKCKKGSLDEQKENMTIPVDDSGVSYLPFSFDIALDKKSYPKGLYPFFKKIEGAHSVCDYILFVVSGHKVYVLLVELKKGEMSAASQLKAGECMAKYVVETINRINKTNFVADYRKITVRGTKLVRKGATKMQKVKFTNGFTTFGGRIFCLSAFVE